MKTIASILPLLVLILLSCEDRFNEETPPMYCGVSDPVTELEWLRTELEGLDNGSAYADFYVYTAIYQGERVFFIDICCPACNVAPPEVRDCEGKSLGRFGDGINRDELQGEAMLWRTLNGVCSRD